ncbi:hypothetical protein MRX96_026973 [Rhipicephalus microplus]
MPGGEAGAKERSQWRAILPAPRAAARSLRLTLDSTCRKYRSRVRHFLLRHVGRDARQRSCGSAQHAWLPLAGQWRLPKHPAPPLLCHLGPRTAVEDRESRERSLLLAQENLLSSVVYSHRVGSASY